MSANYLFLFVVGISIMKKWENIRDAFTRSLKTKTGDAAKSSYEYGEHLQFLLKSSKKEETFSRLQRKKDVDVDVTGAEPVNQVEVISESIPNDESPIPSMKNENEEMVV